MTDSTTSKQTTRRSARRIFVAAIVAVVAVGLGLSVEPPRDGQFVSVSSSQAVAQDKADAKVSADKIAERVQRFYKKTTDFHADFNQTYTDVAAGSAKTSQGKVYFKKPGKMRWDYYSGEGREKVLVSDGATFWIYEYEFKQVFKKCLAESQLPTSLKFLMGQGELLEEFDVSYADGSSDKEPVLELVPKEPTSKYTKLIFELDPETFQVNKTTVFDPYGNTNAIEFSEAKINKNLPDNGFEFEPPKGARLLNPQKECGSPDTGKTEAGD
jgi:outer membrane lipoprotein carrier protein